jgi:hypothetical protein
VQVAVVSPLLTPRELSGHLALLTKLALTDPHCCSLKDTVDENSSSPIHKQRRGAAFCFFFPEQQKDKIGLPKDGLCRGNTMKLTAPTQITFFISVLIAMIAAVIHYAHLSIPHVQSGFLLLLIGYLVLVACTLFDRIYVRDWSSRERGE